MLQAPRNPFKKNPFRVNSSATRKVDLLSNGQTYESEVTYNLDGTFEVNGLKISGALLKNPKGETEMKWRVGKTDQSDEQIGKVLQRKKQNSEKKFRNKFLTQNCHFFCIRPP